jgi:hypothetical protein
MTDTRKRWVILAASIAVLAVCVACLGVLAVVVARSNGTLISRRELTSTPTKTPKPTFTLTLTPTQTPIPTETPIPTATTTPTSTPLPITNTPVVLTATNTPAPPATVVPTATRVPPTNTPKPTRRPTKRPQPTNTKPPPPPVNTPVPQYEWNGQVANVFPNCALTAIFGETIYQGGTAGDIWIHTWTDGWAGDWTQSFWAVEGNVGDGTRKNWGHVILGDAYARAGKWHVCVVPDNDRTDCISNTMDIVTVSEPCQSESGGAQVVRIVFNKN